jgi:hypothetical protein
MVIIINNIPILKFNHHNFPSLLLVIFFSDVGIVVLYYKFTIIQKTSAIEIFESVRPRCIIMWAGPDVPTQTFAIAKLVMNWLILIYTKIKQFKYNL